MKRKTAILMVLAAILTVTTSLPGAARTHAYQYDAKGRLVAVTYDDGDGITYTYDANGNLLSRVVVDEVVFKSGFETL